MKKYKLIIFDWDGTLSDSTTQIISNIEKVSNSFSITCPSADSIKKVIGVKASHAFDQLFLTQSDKIKVEMLNLFFNLSDSETSPLYNGVRKLINNLKRNNYLLAIATNRHLSGLDGDLKSHKFENCFDEISCATDQLHKPNPELIFPILKSLKIKPDDAVMVGDCISDILLAENCGIDVIAVSNGIREKNYFNDLNVIAHIESILELEQCLQKIRA